MAFKAGRPFLMGSDPKLIGLPVRTRKQPQHTVHVDAFRIDRYEVSNVNYLRYVLYRGGVAALLAGQPFPRKDGQTSGHRRVLARSGCVLPVAAPVSPRRRNGEKAARGKTGVCSPLGKPSRLDGSKQHRSPGSNAGKYPPLANVDRYDNGGVRIGSISWRHVSGMGLGLVRSGIPPGNKPEPGGSGSRDRIKVFRGGSWNEDPEVLIPQGAIPVAWITGVI